MTDPTILTVILNFRTPELTLRAAEAALREMHGIPGEILIVDNGSADDSVEVLNRAVAGRGWNQANRVRVLETGLNRGFGAGCNFAMRAGLSSGDAPDFIYILNSDAWPERGAIRRLRNFLLAHSKAGIVGSFVRGVDDQPQRTAFRFPSIVGEFEMAARAGIISRLLAKSIVPMAIPKSETQVDWVAGASMMLRRRMLDEIGGFDEAFFLFFEETDLCRRAARAGWRTHFLPTSEVIHIGSASTGMKTWRRTPRHWFDSRLHYFLKTHGVFYTVLATLARIAGCIIWRLRRLISDKPQGDPVGFLRDLVAHSLGALFRRRACPGPVSLPGPVAEDRK